MLPNVIIANYRERFWGYITLYSESFQSILLECGLRLLVRFEHQPKKCCT